MINRRNFLKGASLFTIGGLMAGKVGSAEAATAEANVAKKAAAAKKVIGLQTYSLGKELFEDVPGGLKKLKAMGYTTLELAGYNDGKIGSGSYG